MVASPHPTCRQVLSSPLHFKLLDAAANQCKPQNKYIIIKRSSITIFFFTVRKKLQVPSCSKGKPKNFLDWKALDFSYSDKLCATVFMNTYLNGLFDLAIDKGMAFGRCLGVHISRPCMDIDTVFMLM